MLRACVMDFKGNWVEHLPLIEFAYNNSFQSSIGMAPYEALYGRPCRSPMCWMESGEASLIGRIKREGTRTKTIPLVKVLWDHHGVEGATWELESDMRNKYPNSSQGYENLKD
ncbi:hypothetical protein AAG906_021269 [Vitis piasezkii]